MLGRIVKVDIQTEHGKGEDGKHKVWVSVNGIIKPESFKIIDTSLGLQKFTFDLTELNDEVVSSDAIGLYFERVEE